MKSRAQHRSKRVYARYEEDLEQERLTNDDLEHRDMSYEEKKQLSNCINELKSYRNFQQVQNIITKNMPQFQFEYSLDVDGVEVNVGEYQANLAMLNNKTLWKLHEFVVQQNLYIHLF